MKPKMKIVEQVREAVDAMLDKDEYPVALHFPPDLWAYYVGAYDWTEDGTYLMTTARRTGSLFTGLVEASCNPKVEVVTAVAGDPWSLLGENELMAVLRHAEPTELAKLPWIPDEAAALAFVEARKSRGLSKLDDLRAVGMVKADIDALRATTTARAAEARPVLMLSERSK